MSITDNTTALRYILSAVNALPEGGEANITAENITNALGYTPADANTVSQLSDRIDDLGTQEEIVQQVIAALGTPVFGRVDADNNIILTGDLAKGTYTLKYEDSEGNLTEIGSVDIGGGMTNMIPLSIDSDGTPYHGGQGWKTGYRLNSSGTETAQDGVEVIGFIPFTLGDVVYFGNVTMKVGSNAAHFSNQYIAAYDENFAVIGCSRFSDAFIDSPSTTLTADAENNLTSIALDYGFFNYMGKANEMSAATKLYFRISAEEINDNSIITINEEIDTDAGEGDNAPAVTNMIPLSTNADGTLYNGGKGWKTGYRLNSSGAETAADDIEVIGFIPFTLGDTMYLHNITMKTGSSAPKHSVQYLAFYDESHAYISNIRLTDAALASDKTTYTQDASGNLTSFVLNADLFTYMGGNDLLNKANAATQLYIRISAEEINDNSIITLNEPIV